MKKLTFFALSFAIISAFSCKQNETKTSDSETSSTEETTATTESKSFKINPISHASTVLNWDDATIYMDPVGGAEKYSNYANPDMVLITHIHGDHMSPETLKELSTSNTTFIVPQSVADKLPDGLSDMTVVLANDERTEINGFTVTAVAMYNLGDQKEARHPKGRGNGYIIEKDGKRVYFSGDTEDTPEMRALTDIDVAFVCMNLPYTMTVENAASAVLDFKPKQVYPYHYIGKDGLSDVDTFKSIVQNGNDEIEVVQLDWYPSK